MKNKINQVDISDVDLEHGFFHYTNIKNLDTILENGLEPRIGENSLYVEKTPKVFFVEGEKGIIMIMDVWLRWLTSKSGVNKLIYHIGTLYMRIPFCIKSIPNNIVKSSLNSKKKRRKVYNKMKSILDDSVFLSLDLENGIDFDYNDIDEVKSTYYESFLRLLYPTNSNLKDHKMEYWNMHTYSFKVIDSSKILLVKNKYDISANNILIWVIEKNMDFVKDNCKFLYEYYLYVTLQIQKKIL